MTTNAEFVNQLPKAEMEEVLIVLQRRIVKEARADALNYASLLVSTLKAAGRPELATEVANLMKGL